MLGLGEGSRELNVTVTNTGMDVLNGQSATLDVELKIVDEANQPTKRSMQTIGTPENLGTCGSGCTWEYIDYVEAGTHHWQEQTTLPPAQYRSRRISSRLFC